VHFGFDYVQKALKATVGRTPRLARSAAIGYMASTGHADSLESGENRQTNQQCITVF